MAKVVLSVLGTGISAYFLLGQLSGQRPLGLVAQCPTFEGLAGIQKVAKHWCGFRGKEPCT